jgi:predicted N-acetyltransferase YhbS
MAVREVRASGLQYVALATQLLQRIRLADAQAGQWEAADLQWWWRQPRPSDDIGQLFWVDEHGPVAAVILTDRDGAWGCDPLVVPSAPGVPLAAIWASAMQVAEALKLDQIETLIRDDDVELRGLAASSGLTLAGDSSSICWMDADQRPDVAVLADGFALVDRSQEGASPHPMRQRNGAAVQTRLRECSLYDPELDLAIRAPDGHVAGYALFWYDPVTQVGLVEPMRVEEGYWRRGLARAMLTEGLHRLARRGARRLKVVYSSDVAGSLYVGSGFRVAAVSRTHCRKRTVPPPLT